jgi:PilZ domain
LDEKRASPRTKALREAQIYTSGSTIIDCIVKNMTRTGARIEFSAFTQLPSDFRIHFKNTGETRLAEVAWQRGLAAGIRFTDPR